MIRFYAVIPLRFHRVQPLQGRDRVARKSTAADSSSLALISVTHELCPLLAERRHNPVLRKVISSVATPVDCRSGLAQAAAGPKKSVTARGILPFHWRTHYHFLVHALQ
jgi:hypothetical protein